MIHSFGFVLLVGLVVGGTYLYRKVDRLDRDITDQKNGSGPQPSEGY